jgi:hypothetical protein
MQEITIAYSPAIEALVGAFYLKLQLAMWLNATFNCTKFKEVEQNANVWISLDSECKRGCSYLKYGEYLGCYYNDGKLVLHEGMLGLGKHIEYVPYLKGVWEHEWYHHFLPNHIHEGDEEYVYRRENC